MSPINVVPKKHVEIIHGSGPKNVGAQGTIARLSQVLIQETLKGLEPGATWSPERSVENPT